MSLRKLKSLSPFQQRKAAAILGALVADAAVAPLHWIYDQGKVDGLIKAEGKAEFYPSSQCPYYTIPTGNNSTYGDQLYLTLKNIAENKGFDAKHLGDAIFKFFGPDTEYEHARTQSGSPVKGPWTNHCVKIMIANRENGMEPAAEKNSKDPDGLCKAVALAGLLGPDGKGALLERVRECVQTVQLNPVAVDFAAAGFEILEYVIRTGKVDFETAVLNPGDDVKDSISKARDCTDPHVNAAKAWGIACGYPASFVVGLHGIKCAENYVQAVREEIKVAGDTCSRVIFVASVCAARDGLNSIPDEWLEKYCKTEEVLGFIETVVQL